MVYSDYWLLIVNNSYMDTCNTGWFDYPPPKLLGSIATHIPDAPIGGYKWHIATVIPWLSQLLSEMLFGAHEMDWNGMIWTMKSTSTTVVIDCN